MCVSRRGRDGMITADSVDASSRAWSAQLEILLILLQQLRETEKQEGCVENSAASVEMPTDAPFVFHPDQDLRSTRLFDSVTSQTVRFASFLALRMLLDK